MSRVDDQGRSKKSGCRDLNRFGGDQPFRADERRGGRARRGGDRRDRLHAATRRADAAQRTLAPDRAHHPRHHQSAFCDARARRRECLSRRGVHDVHLQHGRRCRSRDADPQDDAHAARRRAHPHLDAFGRPLRRAAARRNQRADRADGQPCRRHALRHHHARRRQSGSACDGPAPRPRPSAHRDHRGPQRRFDQRGAARRSSPTSARSAHSPKRAASSPGRSDRPRFCR